MIPVPFNSFEQAVLIVMQLAIAGPIALAPHIAQPLQQRRQAIEVLESSDVLLVNFVALLPRHSGLLPGWQTQTPLRG
jgi:hypothetical protein